MIDVKSGKTVAEIGAHSRSINAVACHPTRSLIASCGDDSFV